MYTIKHAAERVGISEATLRAWERRYGVVQPQRTESGYRLYDQHSLMLLTGMRELVEAGWSPRQAAQEIRDRLGTTEVPPSAGVDPVAGASPGADGPSASGPTHAGSRQTPPAGTGGELVSAAADLDAVRVAAVLDERFSRGSFEVVVDGWLLPALTEVGGAWAAGRLSVAGEHLVAAAVHRRLAVAFDAASRTETGPRVLVGLPPGARHELGILAFATAARRCGLRVTYLGADLPARDWPGAVTRQRARCVVLSLARRQDRRGLDAVLAALDQTGLDTRTAVGGRYQHLAPVGVHRLGHDIGDAARRLAAELHAEGLPGNPGDQTTGPRTGQRSETLAETPTPAPPPPGTGRDQRHQDPGDTR
jgi:methanogenic corrinoid protein MtbC1